MESEGIYLLREREFTRLNENIYKIGRSINIKTRMNSYPKGSNIELMMGCNDSIKCEKQLLEIFRTTFIQRKEYGSEYFEGDKQEMIAIITNVLNKFNGNDIISSISNSNITNNIIYNKNILFEETEKHLTSIKAKENEIDKANLEAIQHLTSIKAKENEIEKAKKDAIKTKMELLKSKQSVDKTNLEAEKHLTIIKAKENDIQKANKEAIQHLAVIKATENEIEKANKDAKQHLAIIKAKANEIEKANKTAIKTNLEATQHLASIKTKDNEIEKKAKQDANTQLNLNINININKLFTQEDSRNIVKQEQPQAQPLNTFNYNSIQWKDVNKIPNTITNSKPNNSTTNTNIQVMTLYTNDMDIIEINKKLFWIDKTNNIYDITDNNGLGANVGRYDKTLKKIIFI